MSQTTIADYKLMIHMVSPYAIYTQFGVSTESIEILPPISLFYFVDLFIQFHPRVLREEYNLFSLFSFQCKVFGIAKI